MVEVNLEAQSTTVKEGNSIELTVTKLGESNIPVYVLLFTDDVTAKGKQAYLTVPYKSMNLKPIAAHEDYIPLNTTIIFSPNESSQTVLINTNDDSIVEREEVFVVQIVSNSRQVRVSDTGKINVTLVELIGKYL